MSLIIKPKNWSDFQHYKDRSPPWIKLHRSLLDNYEFQSLQLASKALAPCYWLLASEHPEGHVAVDEKKIAWRFRVDEQLIRETVKDLVSNSFFEVVNDDSKVLADCYHDAMPEERRGEAEREAEREAEAETRPPANVRALFANPTEETNQKKRIQPTPADAFRMHLEWRPSRDAIEILKKSKITEPTIVSFDKGVAEFVSYWLGQDTKRNQAGWDHAFAQRIMTVGFPKDPNERPFVC